MRIDLRCCLFRWDHNSRLVLCKRKAKMRRGIVLKAKFKLGLSVMIKDCFVASKQLPVCDICLGLDKD